MPPRSLRKMFLGCEIGKKLGEDLPTFQKDRERIVNDKFSKVNALRKGRLGFPVVGKKPRVEFRQAQETSKAVLVTASAHPSVVS